MLLRLAITAAILAYLATRIDMAEAARAIGAISRPHLSLVLGLVALDRAVMILRWILLLRASGIPHHDGRRDAPVSGQLVCRQLPAGRRRRRRRARVWHEALVLGTRHEARHLRCQEARPLRRWPSIACSASSRLSLMAIVGVMRVGASRPRAIGASPPPSSRCAIACVAVFWANDWLRWIIPAHRHEGFVTRRAAAACRCGRPLSRPARRARPRHGLVDRRPDPSHHPGLPACARDSA